MLRLVRFLVSAVLVSAATLRAEAGAFLLPEGEGQLIAGVGYSEGSRRFDSSGTAVPAPTYRKADVSGYLEYGLTSSLSLILAPTLSHQYGSVASNAVTGSDSSAFGARYQLFGRPGEVIAVQALVQPPMGDQSLPHQLAVGGAGVLAVDLRIMYGKSFVLFGFPVFVDLEPGVRLRSSPFPTEARLDLACGVHVRPHLMVLLQTFSAFAPPSGPFIPRTSYSKLQATLVYDLSRRWSLQAGGFRTIAGRNAVRETGPLLAAWYRF